MRWQNESGSASDSTQPQSEVQLISSVAIRIEQER